MQYWLIVEDVVAHWLYVVVVTPVSKYRWSQNTEMYLLKKSYDEMVFYMVTNYLLYVAIFCWCVPT